MTNRHLIDFGLHPLVGYILMTIAFVGLSAYLFYAIEYAAYLYPLIALSLVSMTGEAFDHLEQEMKAYIIGDRIDKLNLR